MLRWLCFAMIVAGGVLMAISTVRYYRFLQQNRQQRYNDGSNYRAAERMESLALVAMLFFVVGYVVGAVHVLLVDVDGIFLFVGVVFFVGAIFVAMMIQTQIAVSGELRDKTMDAMRAFVNSIEQKDAYTRGHSWHVYHIVRVFYEHLPPGMKRGVSGPKLLDAALLHDVGKIGVPEKVLNKRGPLDAEEWEQIQTHPRQGAKMMEDTCFAEVGPWVMYHHERMDGTGYYGLKGEEIPLEARIIAVADTYSAMTTDREYRPKRSHQQAVEIMVSVAGAQLDATLVEQFAGLDAQELTDLLELVRLGQRGREAAAKSNT